MKIQLQFFCNIVTISLLAACGGASQEQVSGQRSLSPAPQTSGERYFPGTRESYLISRTQQGIRVIEKARPENSTDVSQNDTLVFNDLHINLRLSSLSQKLSEEQLRSLIELYIAFFNRVPDSDGLAYWMEQLISGKSILQIAESFYQAGIIYPELTGYSSDMSNTQFIKIIYHHVLGRTGSTAPSAPEVAYWVEDITSGRQTKITVLIAMLNAARGMANDSSYGWVTQLLNNKIQVGRYFALEQGISFASPTENINRGIAIAAAITANDTTNAMSLIGQNDAAFDLTTTEPTAPRNIQIEAKNGSAIFKFDAPLDDGGSATINYVGICSDGTNTLNASSNQSPLTIQGMSVGTSYQCYMNALNNFGKSENSPSIKIISHAGIQSVPFNGNIVLGAPTESSIRAKIFSSNQSGIVSLSYGNSPTNLKSSSSPKLLEAGVPLELQLVGLPSNSQIFYVLNYQSDASLITVPTSTFSFQTARSTGSNFSFTIQADSHLDENSNLAQYQKTLDNILVDKPDFHIDLGDTFMTEKHTGPFDAVVKMASNQAMVNTRYIYERQHFGRITHSTPLFLANGNHEGELGWLYNNTANNIAIWAGLARQTYYANPVPNSFYSGDTDMTNFVGQRAAWYAWHWGDALFVVLDPYWNSKAQASKDGWNLTLGQTQYMWLSDTLRKSAAKYKFIFLHNLVGGLDGQMRGGIEAAPFYEWGGKNADGTNGFATKRPGWALPIHQLLVNHKVTAVFHGHDHVYVRQSLDGIIYQAVPQPSAANNTSGANLAAAYHYNSGIVQSSSGHIKINVSPLGVKSEYVRSWLPNNENGTRKNRQIDDTWVLPPTQ
jgi:hypothetical protein